MKRLKRGWTRRYLRLPDTDEWSATSAVHSTRRVMSVIVQRNLIRQTNKYFLSSIDFCNYCGNVSSYSKTNGESYAMINYKQGNIYERRRN